MRIATYNVWNEDEKYYQSNALNVVFETEGEHYDKVIDDNNDPYRDPPALKKHIGTIPLETEYLLLRRYCMEDAEDVFANWATDREAARFWSWKPHENMEVTRAILTQWIAEYHNPEYYHWAIIHKEDRQAIGYIYLNEVNQEECSAAVHFLLSRRYWNRGLMSEACREVITFAMQKVGFHKIHSYHHCDNPASGRVLQKCGMNFMKAEYRAAEEERLSGEYLYYEISC